MSDVSNCSPKLDHARQPAFDVRAELLAIRQQSQAVVARCDRLLAAQLPSLAPDDYRAMQARYRVSPGGPLSHEGVKEIRRRFETGETDAVIAREMGLSVQGVAKRRVDFNAVADGGGRRPGALRGRIWMAPDFDELSPEDLGFRNEKD